MIFNVPQFIDVEDKIAGPLTWRQLLWMIGMGAVLLVLYNAMPQGVFIVVAVPIVILFCALAFYRPNNQPLILYIIHGIFFLLRPKVAVWERPTAPMTKKQPEPAKTITEAEPKEKRVTVTELKELARIIDSRGRA